MFGRVLCRIVSMKLHFVTVSLMLLLLVALIGDVTSTRSPSGDRHSLLTNVDIESSDDELAQRDQPMVSHIVYDITTTAAAAAVC